MIRKDGRDREVLKEKEKKHRDSRMKFKLEEYSLTEWDHLGGR